MRDNLRDPKGLPISVRLLCNAHTLLLNGVRGKGKQPGAFRRSQNWLGGTRPGNAVFVPPPADKVPALMSDLEQFIHDQPRALDEVSETALPPLVAIALAHAQFETIHPFLDGNGRIGRLLISALLEDLGLLPEPLLSDLRCFIGVTAVLVPADHAFIFQRIVAIGCLPHQIFFPQSLEGALGCGCIHWLPG